MIRNLIIDMGNVLIYFKPDWFVKRIDCSDEDRETLKNEVFFKSEWHKLDTGEMNEEQAYKSVINRLPERLYDGAHRLIFNWEEPITEVPGMYEFLNEAKKRGFSLYLLSNASSRQHEYWSKISSSIFFDGTIVSADVRKAKPDRELFEELFKTFSLKPEECFFIDDWYGNVNAGKEAGMEGFVFSDNIDELKTALNW